MRYARFRLDLWLPHCLHQSFVCQDRRREVNDAADHHRTRPRTGPEPRTSHTRRGRRPGAGPVRRHRGQHTRRVHRRHEQPDMVGLPPDRSNGWPDEDRRR